MTENRFALYATNVMGPSEIAKTTEILKGSGCTTILLGLFHIGWAKNSPPDPPQTDAQIFFNSTSIIQGGKNAGNLYPNFDKSWPQKLADLKKYSGIKEIYASFGGGDVKDFGTIQKIYQANKNSLKGSLLEKNIRKFRENFRAVDGIDMDCEETYDVEFFVAFCRMLIEDTGDPPNSLKPLSITFCPFTDKEFWLDALEQLNKTNRGAVKWWNLQCYDGGYRNDPQDWRDAIMKRIPDFTTDRFILASDWSRFKNDQGKWQGDCPPDVKMKLSNLRGNKLEEKACVGGAFLWNLDLITQFAPDKEGCPKPVGPNDYFRAVRDAFL